MIDRRNSEALHRQITQAQERIDVSRGKGDLSEPPNLSSEEAALKSNAQNVNSNGPGGSKVIFIIAAFIVVLPFFALVLGAILNYAIPGCHVDEGAGGRGCLIFYWDVSKVVAFLELGGLAGLLISIPISLLLAVVAAVVSLFNGKE